MTRLVQQRVDWLTLAYRLEGVDWPALDLRATEARELACPVAWAGRVGGYVLALQPSSRAGRIQWATGDAHGMVCRSAAGGWVLEVVVRPIVLALHGLAGAVDLAQRIAETFGAVAATRVRRVDLATDWQGWEFFEDELRRWVAWSTTRVTEHAKFSEHDQADVSDAGELAAEVSATTGYPSGVVVGRGNLLCRIYDKTRELAVKRARDKEELEHAVWKANGWDGSARMVRVEFQLRGAALDELKIRDPKKLLALLDPVWQYCTRRWLRCAVPDTASRRARWETDERWEAVRAVTWVAPTGVAVRVRRRGTVTVGHVLGVCRSYLAGLGKLEADPRFPAGGEREAARALSACDRETILHDLLWALFRDAFHAAGRDLTEEHGQVEALARIAASVRGTVASFARTDP